MYPGQRSMPGEQLELYEYKQDALNTLCKLKEDVAKVEITPEDAETICFFGIQNRDKIELDFELYSQFILCLTAIIKSTVQTEESKAFAKKMLRWLLVQDPDHREIRAMKRCFLMNKSIDSFRIKQIELAMELVQDSAQFSAFLTLEPAVFGKRVQERLERIIEASTELDIKFISCLIVEFDSYYFKSLASHIKQKLCRMSVDCLQLSIVEFHHEDWLIELLAQDQAAFAAFQSFHNDFQSMLPFLTKLSHSVATRANMLGAL